MTAPDEFAHFVDAQRSVYGRVVEELARGRKRSHWMWFVFPQLRGLGRSGMSERYALDSVAQACQYLAHPVLGSRLIECTTLVLGVEGRTARDIFGGIDAMKFHSSMTLFSLCDAAPDVFSRALAKYFAGAPDLNTFRLLEQTPRNR